MIDLADFLYKERIAQNLTQRELAKIAGFPAPAIHRYETGITDPSFFRAECILNALGYKIDITLEEPNE